MAGAGTIQYIVVDPDPSLRSQLSAELGSGSPTVSAYSNIDGLLDRLAAGQPAVVVCGPGLSDPTALREIERLIRERPEAGVILVAAEFSTGVLQNALRAGVRDVLAFPVAPEAFNESVSRVKGTLRIVPGGLPASEQGRLITVASMKGGSGKSVVATNLAAVLAKESDRPVALIDADLQFGDVAVLMRLMPQHTVADAVTSLHQLDAQLLQSLLVQHEQSGLYVLAAPPEPSFADRVTGDEMLRIADMLRSFCAYVVVDTPSYFNDVVLGLIEHSDDVVLVAGMDIPSIKNIKLGLQTLRLISVDEFRIKLVLNRANSKVKLDVASVERTLGIKADVKVPSDITIPESVNKGVPVVFDAPKSLAARSFAELANLFLSADADVPIGKARSRFGLF